MVELKVHPNKDSRKKIMRSMANTGFLNVWEGAVRSSKTVIALVAFLVYVMESEEEIFMMSGNTLGSLEKNVIKAQLGVLNLVPGSVYAQKGRTHAITIPTVKGAKTIYVYGASDSSSFESLRGLSAGGWFADEINLHDEEFVAEGFRRTIASTDRKHFWTLNPDNPYHWVYEKYIDYYDFKTKDEKKEIGGFHLWKFYIEDNPIIDEKRRAEIIAQYRPGSFDYRRYILGERCMAEGLIYPGATEDAIAADIPDDEVNIRYCAIDFGVDHPTVMYLGGPLKSDRKHWHIVDEYYSYHEDKTTLDFFNDFCAMCERHGVDWRNVMVAIDPAAGALKVEFQRHHSQAFNAKNDVLDGIEYTKKAMYNRNLTVSHECRNLFKQLSTYVWDETASMRGVDKPLKVNDDCPDAERYFAYTHMRLTVGL